MWLLNQPEITAALMSGLVRQCSPSRAQMPILILSRSVRNVDAELRLRMKQLTA
jgi:hypothetical protein